MRYKQQSFNLTKYFEEFENWREKVFRTANRKPITNICQSHPHIPVYIYIFTYTFK